MDSFDYDSLSKSINGFKSQIKTKFQAINFTSKEIRNNVENLCLVWDYSPKMNDERKRFGRILTYLILYRYYQN